MSTLTRSTLVQQLSAQLGLPKSDVEMIIITFYHLIKESLIAGKHVKLSSFGNFMLKDKKKRIGRNPKTGEVVPIASRRVVTFRPGHKLRVALNTGILTDEHEENQ